MILAAFRWAVGTLAVAFVVLAWKVLDAAVVPLEAANADNFSLFAASFWGLGAVAESLMIAFVIVSLFGSIAYISWRSVIYAAR